VATQLEEERQSLPNAKLNAVGDAYVGMVVDRAEVPMYEYKRDGSRGDQLIGKNGKPRTQELITMIALPGTTCHLGDEPAAEGALFRDYIKGHNRWAYIEAKNAGHGALCVGDVIRRRFVREEPGEGGGTKKVSDFALRKPKPEESELAARAEREHEAMYRKVLDGSGQAPAGGQPAGHQYDEDDF
jgi:hypothetical protein